MNPNEQTNTDEYDRDSATEIVRQKIENIYKEEPSVAAEEAEIEQTTNLSKHQKFMQELVNSGKSTEQIQSEWHQYYLGLDDKAKKEVWNEFYASNKSIKAVDRKTEPTRHFTQLKKQVVSAKKFERTHPTPRHRRAEVHAEAKVSPHRKLKAKHYFQSLLFGLSMGFVVLVIFLFGFFNQIIIAPLIQPSRNATATPVIIGNGNLTATNVDQVIIPKINVEIPVDYSITTTNENVIENDLESGVVHYPDTSEPGQLGNAAFFGHSSNNIFNPGKYKFAFVLLHTLVKGDTFYLTYNHTIYIYKVISTAIVNPNDVSVLGSIPNQEATATLITCDPPGTSLHRLVVVGQQISPNISIDTASSNTINPTSLSSTLPNDGPTLWSRFIHSSGGKSALIVVGLVIVVIIFRRTNKRIAY